MKKTNKIIAVILAMVLSLSSLSLVASASAIKDDVKTAEALIQGDNLGNLVEWLLKNINNRKEEVVGTVLRIVFMNVEDESLRSTIGTTDLINATDAQLADIFVAWLDANLPTWTADLTTQDWWSTVTSVASTLGITIDLSSVKGVVKTLEKLCDIANNNVFGIYVFDLGTLNSLNENALTPVTGKNAKNLDIVYALFQWLADNTGVVKTALKCQLDLGLVDTFAAGTSAELNTMIRDAIGPDAIKEMLCGAIELDYETYKSYTADEILAAAFMKLLTGNATIGKAEAASVMNLSIYDFLENYAAKIYANLLVNPLNTSVKNLLVDNIKPLDDNYNNILDEVFNWDYEFKADTFDAILGAGKGNMVNQLNNAIITLLKVILTENAFNELGLVAGGNENLEENFAKAFRYILPKIANLDKPIFGATLSGFTAEAVQTMTAEEMAVGVFKLFFPSWFTNAVADDVNKATTLEQLAVLALKYTATNNEWIPVSILSATEAKDVHTMSDEVCIDTIFNISMELAAKSLDYNKATTYYTIPANTAAWTGADYLDDIADWGLNFAKGLPAAADKLSTTRGKLDGNGGFYKINTVFDTLFDMSFVSGCSNSSFDFDFETMLIDKFLCSLLDFDLESAVAILAENEGSSLFNKKINVAVIDLVDELLTGLFDESYQLPLIAGDIDGNGTISANDARLVLRSAVRLENLNSRQLRAADVYKDGSITANDARLILRASVKLETLR